MHDVPERYLGDVPASTKWSNPQLNEVLSLAEERILSDLGEWWGLTPEEKAWLFYTDKLDLFLWCQDQWAAGNSNVRNMISLLDHRFEEEDVPRPILDFVQSYCWERTHDLRRKD
jgi:5'-deoxynucleotidase YfbR-like HD superfamily hydrolase